MKSIKRIIAVVVACVVIASTASAQISFGAKAGIKVNDLDKEGIKAENGYTAGIMAEVMLPVLNLGIDASLMYVSNKIEIPTIPGSAKEEKNRNYLELPVNLKWKLSLPIAGKIIAPYVATGPCFSVLAGKTEIKEGWEQKRVDVSWNLGAGVQLFNKVQIGASYGWGLTDVMEKTSEINNVKIEPTDIGKKNCWTVTAAYIF